MEAHVIRFLEKATVPQLKEKLGALGQETAGQKASLKMRLTTVVKTLQKDDLYRHFPKNILADSASDEEENSVHETQEEILEHNLQTLNETQRGSCTNNEDELINGELEILRTRLQKKKEIQELKRKLSELTEDEDNIIPKSCFNFRDVEESLPRFNGEDNYSIQKWLQNFEESAEIFGWDSHMRYIYAKRLMTGTAKLFLRSTSLTSWQQLKTALEEEFSKKVTNADVHNELRNRRKKRDESFQTYVLCMQEIASLGNIEESDIIHYIINGITDSSVNKMLLYNANTLPELKLALKKYEKFKSTQPVFDQNKVNRKDSTKVRFDGNTVRCYNCSERGHTSRTCNKTKRTKGSCFKCGKLGHRVEQCNAENQVMTVQSPETTQNSDCAVQQEKYVYPVNNKFEFYIRFTFNGTHQCCNTLLTLLDTGSAISFVQECFIPSYLVSKVNPEEYNFVGINGSRLQVVGSSVCKVNFENVIINIKLFIVQENSMNYPVILGRDFLNRANLKLTKDSKLETSGSIPHNLNTDHDFPEEILNIDIADDKKEKHLNINENIPSEVREKVIKIVNEADNLKDNQINNKLTNELIENFEMRINLTKDSPFYCTPRRLPYSHKIELRKILKDLLERNIIRESNSPYASPIVLVQKKNKELRMCIDFRELNKITVRDNYPLPLIDDLLDRLHNKRYFSILDLRSGFHHVKMAENSIKFTSFVTPLGQFEYLKMPFGLKNAPSVFQKFINCIFKDLISSDQLFAYMDDLLIASATIDEHLDTLKQVMKLINENSLELRYDKCKFFFNEIVYLGYVVNADGIRPNPENLRAISEFPTPKCVKGVQSFLGLCSYFRRFIQNFSLLAKPLYDLLKKNVNFNFGEKELYAFENLKSKLIESPILAIYSPKSETELHCDASSSGFGAILLQRQSDNKFHPVFYFSKRATDLESKYHSYELETLSIVYALRRFRIYLTGVKFKIVTDCQALTLTLNKKLLNARIARWALEMQNFDYIIEHRPGNRMHHVDALSRCSEILLIEEGSFEFALAAAQHRDPLISQLASQLEKGESQMYALINGLVYRKFNNDVRFYVPKVMENQIIQTHHESLCHLGAAKCYEHIRRFYWFPDMREKIKKYISNCLKCVYFSPVSGKIEGNLHSIPKGDKPFEVLHIDHFGPLPPTRTKKNHILLVIDGFSKFTKLYPVGTTKTQEVISCLQTYFSSYSRPKKIVSDRGTAFSSEEFAEFVSKNNVIHVQVATGSPQSNGQAERVNRIINPMISKELDPDSRGNWYLYLSKIEFALNNTIHRSTNTTPSMLLFGVNQKGEFCDKILEYLENSQTESIRDLNKIRSEASEKIIKNQQYNKAYYDKKHKPPHIYKEGDLVMIKNIVTTPGINKKFLPKYRGPYKVIKVLKNDRYMIQDLDNLQLGRIPYKGVCCPANMKPYIDLDCGDDLHA